MGTTTTDDRLFGLAGDEWLATDPEERLERLWDQADPPLVAGGEAVLTEWESLPPDRFMPSADRLIDRSRDDLYDAVGEDSGDTVRWNDPELVAAAQAYVDRLNQLIRWRSAGRKVAMHRYRLVDAERGVWERLDLPV